MKLIRYALIFCILVLGVTFACLNSSSVDINLYIGTYQLHLSILLLITLGIGMIMGYLVMGIAYLRLKAENHRLIKQNKWVEKEVSNLRALPLQEEHV